MEEKILDALRRSEIIGIRSCSGLGIMMALKASDAGETPSALAVKVGVTRANITNVSKTLEKQGFVDRTQIPDNRRSVLYTLTKEGEEAVRKILEGYELP